MAANDKTVYEGNDTVYENDGATVYEDSGATVYEGSIAEAAIAEAAKHSGESLQNSDIVKGSSLMDTYTVESSAINGGMGSVWRVHHNGWNVDLAMKRPKPAFFATPETKERFIKECRVWIDLGLHPNIVSCYYVRDIGGTPSIFSEWMENGSLGDRIADESLYQGSEAEQHKRLLDIAIQFARGLHYAHEQGLIHQDVKPDNLMLTSGWDAKVSDFGIANARAQLTVLEVEVPDGGTIVSASGARSPHYCSMEQMDGKTLTRRTDIYSWAVSVLEMYLGCKPWAGASYDTGPMAGLNCREYFEQARIPMPQKLKELLAKCLASEPENRPHDFGIVEEELKAIYQQVIGEKYLRPAPQMSADTAPSLNNRAVSFIDLGNMEQAEQLLDCAVRADNADFICHYNAAVLLWHNLKITYEEMLDRILQHSDGSEQAQALIEKVRFIAGEQQNVSESSIKFLGCHGCDPIFCTEWRREGEMQEKIRHGNLECTAVMTADKQLYIEKNGRQISIPGTTLMDVSYDMRMAVSGCRFWTDGGGYHLTDLESGETRTVRCFIPENVSLKSLNFVGLKGEILTAAGQEMHLFETSSGRSLGHRKRTEDPDGYDQQERIFGYSEDGTLMQYYINDAADVYHHFITIPAPKPNVQLPWMVERFQSYAEIRDNIAALEKDYLQAKALFDSGSILEAKTVLQPYCENGRLLGHEAAVRLWTKMDVFFERTQLVAVLPTDDEAFPVPPVEQVVPMSIPEGTKADSNRGYAENGIVSLSTEYSYRMYENYNGSSDIDSEWALDGYDAKDESKRVFHIPIIRFYSQTDESLWNRELYMGFLPDGRLWHMLEYINMPETIDLANPVEQGKYRMVFSLPGDVEMRNTENGLMIDNLTLDDAFEGCYPVWNARILRCRKRNYRLVYRYGSYLGK